MIKMDIPTWARTIVLLAALLNQVLTSFNLNPIPFSDTQIYNAVTVVLTVTTSLIAWYKNNELKRKETKQSNEKAN